MSDVLGTEDIPWPKPGGGIGNLTERYSITIVPVNTENCPFELAGHAEVYALTTENGRDGYIAATKLPGGRVTGKWLSERGGGSFFMDGTIEDALEEGIRRWHKGPHTRATGPRFVGDKAP